MGRSGESSGAWWRPPGHWVKTDDLWAALAGGQGCGPGPISSVQPLELPQACRGGGCRIELVWPTPGLKQSRASLCCHLAVAVGMTGEGHRHSPDSQGLQRLGAALPLLITPHATRDGSDFHFTLCPWITLARFSPSGPQFPMLNKGWAEPHLLPIPTRSLDRLDSVDMLLPSKCPSWEEDYHPISDSLNDSSCISQVRVAGSQKVRGLGRAPTPTQEKDRRPGPASVEWPPNICPVLLFGLCS